VPGVRARAATAVLTVTIAVGACGTDGSSRQDLVAERGAQVMPFDLDATTHDFEPTPDGGIQTVTADDPGDLEQIQLIRQHLAEERAAFATGDFGDPIAIHGHDMPGVAELTAGADRIDVRYEDVPAGGRLHYATVDGALVEAIHDWFDAQTMDHGEHADGQG